jgi:hypothetical protein
MRVDKMPQTQTLYHTPDRTRWFIIPADEEGPPGTLAVQDLEGHPAQFHPLWLARYEVTEAEALKVARGELGETLEELRSGIDETLAGFHAKIDAMKQAQVADGSPYTADSVPALLALIGSLPGLVGKGLSGDKVRLDDAKASAMETEARLKAAGIDIEGRLSGFPDRLAALRAELKQQKK